MKDTHKSKYVINPQLENGYTPIANEILEKLARLSLSSNQWQVLLVIIRKTYGFHKKVDYIANFQIGTATGLGKTVISRILRNLSDRHIITRKGKIVGLQKNWGEWQGLAEQLTFEHDYSPKLKIVRDDGYIGIWKTAVEPEFKCMTTNQGYVLEHRLVMARLLGRPLESWEVVHHKGTKYPTGSMKDKGDNREENLELLPSQAAHMPSILAQKRIKQLETELSELLTIIDSEQCNEKLAISSEKLAISSEKLAKQSKKVSSSDVTQKIKETITKDTIQKKEVSNKKYGEFKNVSLSDNEYEKLKEKFGEDGAKERIETLSAAIASKGYKYKSHYATILSWDRRDLKKKGPSGELPSTKILKEEWEQ